MEFLKQYLTYDEYRELGGTLKKAPFNILELEAQRNIDKYTSGRLQNIEKQSNEVKICVYQLIGLFNTYNSYENQNKAISSESTDGYSISYNVTTKDVAEAKMNDIKGIINTCLAECYTNEGVPYLFRGVR